MQYSDSADVVVHGGTGHRMHSDTAPIPSAVSASDMNMLIWSLMAVIEQAGLAGIAFDAAVPASYQRFRDALQQLFITPAELASYAPAATDSLQGLVELATSAEGIAGADFARVVSPGVLAAVLSAKVATTTEMQALTALNRLVTPGGLATVLASRPGHVYTANDWAWIQKPTRSDGLDGLIIQWFTAASVASDGQATVTFGSAFPNNNFVSLPIAQNSASGVDNFGTLISKSPSGCVVARGWVAGTTGEAGNVLGIAIGN